MQPENTNHIQQTQTTKEDHLQHFNPTHLPILQDMTKKKPLVIQPPFTKPKSQMLFIVPFPIPLHNDIEPESFVDLLP